MTQPQSHFRIVWLSSACICALWLPHSARAQLLDRYFPANVPAYTDWFSNNLAVQIDPAYRPLGVTLGSFVISPSVTEAIGYDTNLAGTRVSLASPELQNNAGVAVDSNWARNSVNATVSVNDVRYFDYPDRSYTDWTIALGGTLEVADNDIRAGYSHINAVSLPTDIGTLGLAAPVIDQVDDIRISDTIGTGPLRIVPSLDGQFYRFQALSGTNGADGDLFDRNALTASLTTGYSFAGGHNLLLVVSDTHVEYPGTSGGGRPANDDDLTVLGGVEYRQSALFVYRALVGYERRFYEGAGTRTGTLSVPSAELDVIWSPTALTSVTGRVSQGLADEPSGISQGLTELRTQVIGDYAFRANIGLEISAGYDRDSFPTSSEVQSGISAGFRATWNLNRAMALSIHDDFSRSDDSTVSMNRFSRNVTLLELRYRL